MSRIDVSTLDFRLGLRMLARYPMLAIVGIASISLAVGATAVFTAFSQNFIDPKLPLPQGSRIVTIQNWDVGANRVEPRALHDFVAWREELQTVEDVGAFTLSQRTMTTGEGLTTLVRVAETTAAGFRVAGIAPLLGRQLLEADERTGVSNVAVIGYELWETQFSGDASVIGRTIGIGGLPHTVVGVMPAGFGFPFNQNVWTAFRHDPAASPRLEGPSITVFGKLRDRLTIDEAQAELDVVGSRAAADSPDTHSTIRPRVRAYAEAFIGSSATLGIVGARAGFVVFLLIICANVGALVFIRNFAREQEIGIRSALGASPRRIVIQLFVEGLVLASIGSITGLCLAAFGTTAVTRRLSNTLLTSGPDGLPFWWRDSLSPQTIAIVLGATVLGAMASSLSPAWASTRRGLGASAGKGATRAIGTKAKFAIVGQVAFCVGLLTMAIGELPDTIRSEVGVEGLSAEDYLTTELRVEGLLPGEPGPVGTLARYFNERAELARRLSAEPDVHGVTFATGFPGMLHPQRRFVVEGVADGPAGEPIRTAEVDLDFFDVMGVELIAGRTFSAGDILPDGTSRAVAIVNESFALRRFGTMNVVGRRVRLEPATEASPWLEIIGVVADFGMNRIDASRPEGLYRPLESTSYPVRVGVRMRTDPAQFIPRLRTLATEVSPAPRLASVRPLSTIIDSARAQQQVLYLAILATTAIVVVLSLTAVYGVTSFLVRRRTREIGIRAALGASPGRLIRDVFGRATLQLGGGVVIGTLLTIPLLAIGLEQGSTAVAVQVSIAILVAGLLACLAPMRRMLRVEPTEAMRLDV
ncbi:MAG: FtsX-like permease family protein [Gemmatimonas sp.]|nr:FtsX-like permease family protein [Gemmatimonas sp.]